MGLHGGPPAEAYFFINIAQVSEPSLLSDVLLR